MSKKVKTITVLNEQIRIIQDNYISLTDMLKSKGGEFATIRNQTGLNSYKISVKEWFAFSKLDKSALAMLGRLSHA